MEKSMLKRGIASQMLAGLTMLKDCIDRCPEKEWDEKQNDYPFSQILFHVLFDCDFNLSDSEQEFRGQGFHKNYPEVFADYQELMDLTKQHPFDRRFINSYYDFCMTKIKNSMRELNDGDLTVPNTDIYKNMTKLERYVNAIRHIQHHTAQLGLRLQFITGVEMEWISRGYEK